MTKTSLNGCQTMCAQPSPSFQNPRGNERIITGFETLLKLKRGCIQHELKIGFKGPEKAKEEIGVDGN